MKKINKILLMAILAVVLSLSTVAFTACNDTQGAGYTVTFETFGGTVYEPVKTETANTVVKLPIPEKIGAEFEGWFDNAEYSGEALDQRYLPTADVTLYAKWSYKIFVVSFETFGGTKYKDVEVCAQKVALPTPEKEGYVFMGWYETEDFSGEKLEGEYLPTASVTLYALWQEEGYFYVNFETFGGTTHAQMRHKGEGVTLPVPFKYGYEFGGWYLSSDCEGAPVGEVYSEELSVLLFAKWTKVTYLYTYFGDSTEHVIYSYAPGTVVTVSEIPTPEDLIVEGYNCPFVRWVYDGLAPIAVGETITLGDEHVYIVAEYDYSNLPAKERIEVEEDGSVTTTGKAIKVFLDEGTQIGGYSLDISFRKGKSGAANIAFRMIHSGADYAYEDANTYYIAVGMGPTSGVMQISKVANGSWSRVVGDIALSALPKAWQDKFNSANDSDKIKFNLTVYDYGTSFAIYLDGDHVYTCSDSALLATFKGTGLGMRSSTTGSNYSNWKYEPFKTVRLNANGGSEVGDIKYSLGKIDLPAPTKASYVFTGWYYDEECTQAVDVYAPVIEEGITLYAGWREAKYTVTLIENGKEIGKLGYEEGSISLPVAENRENAIFTGWYYDESCTKVVNEENPEISSNVNLYAGFRYPLTYITDNKDGTYTVSKKTAGSFGIIEHPYYQYDMNVSFTKGVSGAGGIAFRMSVYQDYSYETAGMYYIAVGVDSTSGTMQTSSVINGKWSRLISNTALTGLPQSFQDKFNATASGEKFSYLMTVKDYGTYYEVYFDGEFIYKYEGAALTQTFTGKGIGLRSSTVGLTYSYTVKELCVPVHFEPNNGETIESMHYLSGLTELPVVYKENNVFNGWYTDKELTNKIDEANFVPTEETTLYAGWIKYDHVITLDVNGGIEFENNTLYYAEGVALELPTPERTYTIKENKNMITYIFDGWYLEGVKYEGGSITSDCALVANWKQKETRNGVVVTYDENGNVTYSDSGMRVGSTGASLEAWDMYEVISDYSKSKAYDLRYTLIINSFNPSTAPELRLAFMANPEGYLTEGTPGRLEIDGTGTQSVPFMNLYLTSGRINFGAKITGTSAQPVQGAIDIFAGSKWYSYFKSLTAGDKMEVDVRFVHGISADGTAWFKFYVFDEILYTYGLTADAGTTNMVEGERVYGKILDLTSVKSHAKLQAYLEGQGANIGGSHGFWTWATLDSIGGYSVMNISSKAMPLVTFVNGEEILQQYVSAGETIVYTLPNTSYDNTLETSSYKKFTGWKNGEGELVTSVNGDCTLTAAYEEIAVYRVTFNTNNGEENTFAYYEKGQAVKFPAEPIKNGSMENGTTIGYAFSHWAVGDQPVSEGYTASQAVTVTAIYTSTIAHTVSYETGVEGLTVESSIVADGEIFELPEVNRENYSFYGWYTDADCMQKYEVSAVNTSFTLYAKWVERITVTFISEGKTVATEVVDKGMGLVNLPTATKAKELKENGNLVGYTLSGWFNGDVKYEVGTVIEETCSLIAKYTAKETRNGVVVTYDENGNVTYTENSYRLTDKNASVEGYDFPEVASNWSLGNAYEISYTVSLGKKSTTATELRLMFLTNATPYLTGGCDGHLEVDGTNNHTVWVDIYLQNGRVNFGGKLTGTTGQPYGGVLSTYEGTKWYKLYNSTAVGSPMSFDVKIQQGIYDDGSAWFKFYLEGELFFTYGFTADEGTTNVVDGETVYGTIIPTVELLSKHKKLGLYLAGSGREIGGAIGAWTWANIPNTVGSITFSNFKSEDISLSTSTNGGSQPKYAFVTNGKLHTDGSYKAGNTFTGWYYDGELTLPVDVNNFDLSISNIIYAGWKAETHTVTLIKDGKEYAKTGYTEGAINLPEFGTEVNRIYSGWYYDEAFTQAVDTSNPQITTDTTLYAGWRYPTHSNFIDNGNGNYGIGNGSAIQVLGEMGGAVEHTMVIDFKKKGGGGCGIAFRMKVYGDNAYEQGAQYLTVDICPNDGTLQVALIDGTFAHITSTNKVIPLASLPVAWQNVYNSAADQEVITLELTVKDYGTYFEAYLNGDLAYTSTKDLSTYDGVGYGVRSSTKNITFTYEAKPLTVNEEA